MGDLMYCTVKALIPRDGKFLFLEYGPSVIEGVFDLPGGRLNTGEAPEDALAREVKEETGLDVVVGKLAGVYHFIREEDGVQTAAIVFECRPKKLVAPENSSQDSIKAFHWLSLEEALCKPLGAKTSIADFLKNYSTGEARG